MCLFLSFKFVLDISNWGPLRSGIDKGVIYRNRWMPRCLVVRLWQEAVHPYDVTLTPSLLCDIHYVGTVRGVDDVTSMYVRGALCGSNS